MTGLDPYVGLPHRDLGRDRDGVDCWGLLRLVYRDELGIALPSYTGDYASCEERRELSALIAGETEAGPWHRVERVRRWDALLFRIGPHSSHIALAVDGRRMLHVAAGRRSVIEPINSRLWRDRHVGTFRHEALS